MFTKSYNCTKGENNLLEELSCDVENNMLYPCCIGHSSSLFFFFEDICLKGETLNEDYKKKN